METNNRDERTQESSHTFNNLETCGRGGRNARTTQELEQFAGEAVKGKDDKDTLGRTTGLFDKSLRMKTQKTEGREKYSRNCG